MQSRTWHRLFLRAALSGAHIFAWVFIFQFLFVRYGSIASAVAGTALTYGLAQAIAVLLTPLTAQRLRNGFRATIAYAVIALACAFVALAAAFAGLLPEPAWGIGLFAVLLGLYRALYWIPYAVARERTPHLAPPWIEVLLALLPIVTGFYLASSPAAPVALLCTAAFVVLLSLVPLMRMRDGQEGYSWTYRQSFHELFSRQRRYYVLSSILSGIEAAALLLLWPLLVFMLLRWSYPVLGIVMALSALLTIVLRKRFGQRIAAASPAVHAVIAASAWVARLTVGGAIGVVVVDTYFETGSGATSRGIDTRAYEHAADSSTFVDEHTALKEMSMGIGRIGLCLLTVLALDTLSVAAAFTLVFSFVAVCAACAILAAQSRVRAI